MKQKTEPIPFSPLEEEPFTRHLEEMSLQGWRLDKFTENRLYYRQAEPSAVRYALAYHPEVGNLDPLPTPSMEFYEDYCRQAGWEPAAVWSAFPQIEVYVSEEPDPVPLHTDPQVRWKVIGDWMERRYIPRLQMGAGIGGLFLLFSALLGGMFAFQSSGEDPALLPLYLGMVVLFLLLSGALLLGLVRSYRTLEAVRQAQRDGTSGPVLRNPPPARWRRLPLYLISAAAGLLVLYMLWLVSARFGARSIVEIGLSVGLMFLLFWLVDRARDFLRLHGRFKSLNWLLYAAVWLAAFYVLTKI